MRHFFITVGFISGYFVYQLIKDTPDFSIALERSFFTAFFYGYLFMSGVFKKE